MTRPTAERVRDLLSYEPETGEFRWLESTAGHGRKAGELAGCRSESNGVVISIDGTQYKAHMLAWLVMTGEWPTRMIDHRDGDNTNNRWRNLRPVTPRVNQQNMRRAMRSNKSSGLLGVSKSRSRVKPWKAQIRIDGAITHLGCFKTPEEAHAAYVAAKRTHHEGCTL